MIGHVVSRKKHVIDSYEDDVHGDEIIIQLLGCDDMFQSSSFMNENIENQDNKEAGQDSDPSHPPGFTQEFFCRSFREEFYVCGILSSFVKIMPPFLEYLCGGSVVLAFLLTIFNEVRSKQERLWEFFNETAANAFNTSYLKLAYDLPLKDIVSWAINRPRTMSNWIRPDFVNAILIHGQLDRAKHPYHYVAYAQMILFGFRVGFGDFFRKDAALCIVLLLFLFGQRSSFVHQHLKKASGDSVRTLSFGMIVGIMRSPLADLFPRLYALELEKSQNSGPKRHWDNQALYEKEYGNKRIRRSESDGETNSSKPCYDIPYKNISLYMARPGYSPWLPLPPPVSKGRKSSSSTPGAENHITQCRSDRAWSDTEIVFGAESSSFHDAKPPFFDRRTVFTKQAEPVSPKDPTSDMTKISKHVHGYQNGSYDRKRWLDCPPYGDAINFIIPSKVPLRESFDDKIVINKRYSPQQGILLQRRLGRKLGLVIDLTNTDRESDWTTREVFGEQLPRTFVCPQTPEWKRSPDRDDDVASGLQDNGFQENQVKNVVGAGEMANVVGEDEMENVTVPSEMTNDDILGYAQCSELRLESMRQFCNKSFSEITGSHPVSLSRIYANVLTLLSYFLMQGQLTTLEAAVLLYTWKADGTRYMMLLTRDGCYLIDRKFDFRSVNLRFPRGNANEVACN
ncbi:mRNA-capping enzyme-like protein isoform X2 [Tanacetum coccineum]